MNDLASSDFLRLGGVVVRNELAKQLREPHMPGAAPYPALRATFSPLRAGLSGESLRLWRVLDAIFQRRGATPADRRQPAIAPASYVQDHIRLCGAMAGPPLRSGPPGDCDRPAMAARCRGFASSLHPYCSQEFVSSPKVRMFIF